jgi:hypothetical protein
MVAEWFYVEQGQRRGPVTWQQLQQLAAGGQLKPADLVWKNGMAQWSPASTQAGLFGGPAPAPAPAAPPAPKPAPSAPAAPSWSAPASTPSKPAPAATNPAANPTAPAGAPAGATPAPPAKAGMSRGFKLALLGGGAGIVFLTLCCGAVGLFLVLRSGNEKSWKLDAGKSETWSINFKKDDKVEITATASKDGDLELTVWKTKADAEKAAAGKKEGMGVPVAVMLVTSAKECKLTFEPPETQEYYVVLFNIAKEGSNDGKLVYKSTSK